MEVEFQLGLSVGLLAVLAVGIYFSVFRVEEGYTAVMTSFGRALFVDGERRLLQTWGPGLHWKKPWQKIYRVSLMERILDMSGKEGGRTAMTKDGTILRLDLKLRYRITADTLYTYLFHFKNPVDQLKGRFSGLVRNAIANFQGGSTNTASLVSYDRIRSDLQTLNQSLENFCRKDLSQAYGVEFTAVDLTDILPPDELADALNAVINTQTEMHSQYARAEAECQQRVLASEKGVEIAKAKAEAVETDILTVGTFLAELQKNGTLGKYVERRRAEVHFAARSVYFRRSS